MSDNQTNFQPENPQPSDQQPVTPGASNHTSGLGMASFVLGIVSSVLTLVCCCCLPGAPFPFALTGLILGIIAYKKEKSNLITAGLIMCSIVLGISVLMFLIAIICSSSAYIFSPKDFRHMI